MTVRMWHIQNRSKVPANGHPRALVAPALGCPAAAAHRTSPACLPSPIVGGPASRRILRFTSSRFDRGVAPSENPRGVKKSLHKAVA